jgi:predicted acyl esterase
VEQLPVEGYHMLELPPVSALAPYFPDWVAHERDDDYWRPWKISDHYGEMNIKALHSGGWHDIFLKGTIQNYAGMRRASPARADQRLLLGPWAHAETSPEGKIGDVTFGKSAVLDTDATILGWYDYALKGARNAYATGAPVRIFIMGENAWRDEQEFPLARTRYTSYYLRQGALSTDAPGAAEPEQYQYDPARPVPTIYASSSAVDTDFTALLADVEPSGYARFLTDGIVRARYRNSTQRAEPIEPGKIYEYSIDLWATSNLFKAGHRIRLYVSSSNFPRFDRNLNTGKPIAGSVNMIKAQQRIYHDSQHPSALVLPVIPR